MFNTHEARPSGNYLAITVRIPNSGPGATLVEFDQITDGFWASTNISRTFEIARKEGETKNQYKERVSSVIYSALVKE